MSDHRVNPKGASHAAARVEKPQKTYPHELHGLRLTVPLAVEKKFKEEIPTNNENAQVPRPIRFQASRRSPRIADKGDKTKDRTFDRAANTLLFPHIKRHTPHS